MNEACIIFAALLRRRSRRQTTDPQPQSQLPSALAVGRCGNPPSQPRRARGHGDRGIGRRQVLKATLTLFQPGGGHILPTIYWCPHQVFKATGAPAAN
jgi:hypothetical protein